MSRATIAAILVGGILAAAAFFGAFNAGKNAGREQSHLDRLDVQVQSLSEARAQVDKRLDELERWRNRFGKQPGSAQ